MPEISPRPIRLITLTPGHFHAALVQKHQLPGVHPRVHVYAPLDDDLTDHVSRIASFNTRSDHPTRWELDIRAGANYRERFLREQPGNTVVLSGRNQPKIDQMREAVENNLNVLADKPWIIDIADLPKLEQTLADAERREVFLWDIMTERFEVTNAIQRELVLCPEIFGEFRSGTAEEPGLSLTNVHCIKKRVAGTILRRPPWWFDVSVTGEGLADVGTHLVDLALGLLAPGQALDRVNEVSFRSARTTPLMVHGNDFCEVTGREGFTSELAPWIEGQYLRLLCNGTATLRLREVWVHLSASWNLETEQGWGDTYEIIAHGSRATITTTHDKSFGHPRQVFVAPNKPSQHANVYAAVQQWCREFRTDFPGLSAIDYGDTIGLHIPDRLRANHESLFSAVVQDYLRYYHNPRMIPAWERANFLTKYQITTQAVALARTS